MLDNPKCRGSDTELFYDRVNWAKVAKICNGCPIVLECRMEFADDPYAFAGGMDPDRRYAWAREWRKPAPPARKVPGKGGRPRLTDETKREILRLWDEEGRGARAIALRLGIATSTASAYLKSNNRKRTEEQERELARRCAAAGSAMHRAKGEETTRNVLGLLGEGYSVKEVTALLGISFGHIYKIKREAAS